MYTKMIYFDNASTSFPKAPGLGECTKKFIETSCFNINRSSYNLALKADGYVYETRDLIAKTFGATNPKNVVFTSGTTQSVNIALRGLVHEGDVVASSTFEHNAVYRTLELLRTQGVTPYYVTVTADMQAYLRDWEEVITTKKPKVVVCTHASNVCGAIMPIAEIGRMCHEYGVIFVVDAAQTTGVLEINMARDNIDVLCFSGHKGLLSVPGIGACVMSTEVSKKIDPFLFGGTGSFSHSKDMPSLLPDKFEAGTSNLVGICALKHSLEYVLSVGMANIFQHEKELQTYFESQLKDIPGVRVAGQEFQDRCAVSALYFDTVDNAEAAFRLDDEYGIMVRSGLQCAPLAHQTLNTFPQGVVRFSFGYTNTKAQVDVAIDAIRTIASSK